MPDRSLFGIRLWRLLTHRRPTIATSTTFVAATVAEQADVPLPDLEAALAGAPPTPSLVRRLAPALGFHKADLFVLAGLPVPADLAPAAPTRPWDVGWLIREAPSLSPEQLTRLGEVIRSLPSAPPTDPMPADDYPEVPGALLLRMLKNRNIRPHNAKILVLIGGGPYVSDSTVAMLGHGKIVITPLYVTGFAHLLGYPPADLVAMIGIGPVATDAKPHPASAEIAALAWAARRLTSEQLSGAAAAVKDMP